MTLDFIIFTLTLETWHIVLLYIIGFPIITYLHLGLYYWINGGSAGRHPFWFPYQNFWQDIEWNFLPDAKEKRITWMKTLGTPTSSGWFSSVDHEDVRKNDRYLEMSYKITSPLHFIFLVLRVLVIGVVLAPFVLPFVLYMVAAFPVIVAGDMLLRLWQRSFSYTLPPRS